jgi:hypothetical protein
VALTGGVHTESDPMSLPPHGTEVCGGATARQRWGLHGAWALRHA